MNLAQTAAAKTAPFNAASDTLTAEAFRLALTRGIDKVWKREAPTVREGLRLVREETIKRESATYQTYRDISGLIPQNRDTDDIPFATTGDGFGYTVNTYNFRRGIKIERTLEEIDDVGVAKNRQQGLVRGANLTIEYAIADVFNRGIEPTNAPVLADDGMYLIDTLRPNSDPDAGTWTNQEADSALTPSAIFAAQLAANTQVDDTGEFNPQMVKAIIVRPQDSKTAWEIRNSDYRPTDAMNVNNYFKDNKDAAFDIIVYKYLTAANIYYVLGNPKEMDNELQLFWRQKPSVTTWQGDNPDVMNQRIRMAFGIGLGSPRQMWRGGRIT